MRRLYNRLYAWWHHYFWLPCPSCGNFFGGHEWNYWIEHASSIPSPECPSIGLAICPKCTKEGVGDRAWHESYLSEQARYDAIYNDFPDISGGVNT